jgi:dephospho-CoA kinase
MRTLVIGLTGPIASGKDLAAKVFRRHKIEVIDVDKLGHGLLSSQSKVWHSIVRVFGSKVLNRGGQVNRKKLGQLVFSDKSKLKKLNSIMHPAMRSIIEQKIRAASQNKMIIINAAILKEMKLVPMTDKVVLIIAPKYTRIKRLVKNGISPEEAKRKVSSQISDAGYRAFADKVIVNNSTKKELENKVKKVYQTLCQNLK